MIDADDVQVVSKGDIGQKQKRHAKEKIAHVTRYSGAPVAFARVKLTVTGNPANARSATAQAMLDVDGRPVRGVATAASIDDAIEDLHERLRQQLDHLASRRMARRRRSPRSDTDVWRHGDRPQRRPDYFPRPPEERRVVRRKSYVLEPMSADEAADQMELLDYDFHLFLDAGSGQDALLERGSDGQPHVRLIADDGDTDGLSAVPTLTVEEAIRYLDRVGQHWLFFRDRASSRGAVVYRRYDGHYGVVTSADS